MQHKLNLMNQNNLGIPDPDTSPRWERSSIHEPQSTEGTEREDEDGKEPCMCVPWSIPRLPFSAAGPGPIGSAPRASALLAGAGRHRQTAAIKP